MIVDGAERRENGGAVGGDRDRLEVAEILLVEQLVDLGEGVAEGVPYPPRPD